MARQNQQHVDAHHREQQIAAQPLDQGHGRRHGLVQGHRGDAAPGEGYGQKIGGHQQLHKVQHLPQHVRGDLDAGEETGGQAGEQQQVGDEKAGVGNMPSFKYGGKIGEHRPNHSDDHHLC